MQHSSGAGSIEGSILSVMHSSDSIPWHRAPSVEERQLIRRTSSLATHHHHHCLDDTLEAASLLTSPSSIAAVGLDDADEVDDALVKQRPPLQYWAWLKVGTFNGQRALLWWVGFLFLIGALLFTFVGITELFPVIVVDHAWGLNSLAGWLVYYPGAVGAICFFWTASLVNYVEALNGDYDERIAAWQEKGGKPPQLRLLGADVSSAYWWACIVQVIGTTAFGVASLYGIATLVVPFEVGGTVNRWWQWFCYALGGVCFLTTGWLFLYSVTQSWVKGIIPMGIGALGRSLAYWSMWFYWWGSVGFCMSGLFFYATLVAPGWLMTLQLAIGYGLGSFLFVCSSYCTLLWASNPEHA